MDYKHKYLKYKNKYLNLKGGNKTTIYYGSDKDLSILKQSYDKYTNETYLPATKHKWMGLIMSVELKHFPILIKEYNGKVYIIENGVNTFNFLKKSGYLYSFDIETNKIQNDEYNKFNIKINENIETFEKQQIGNIYESLELMKNIVFIPYEYFSRLFISKIPNKQSPANLNYIWHGSNVDILDGYVKPMNDGFEENNYIYGCVIKSGALLFTVDRWGTDIMWGGHNNYIWIMETVKNAVEDNKELNKDKYGYLYKLDKKYFKVEKYPTYISNEKVPILEKIEIQNQWNIIGNRNDVVMINYNEFKNHIINYSIETRNKKCEIE